ncbi:hypothetical protein M405DRAFT_855106 [Rhizopogon salebrosus TDB-379]|nr:hypothetical protein M405DRAFT_855106 [Rhizopogon salebrosus TDB-379]
MTLPKGLPTLQSTSSKNWTRPDNVFCTDHTSDSFLSCTTNPALHGPATDHVPILSIIDLEIPHTTTEIKHNFRENAAHQLTLTISNAIERHIPKSRLNPLSKRWWTKDLTLLRREVAKLSHLSYRT